MKLFWNGHAYLTITYTAMCKYAYVKLIHTNNKKWIKWL